MLERQSIIGMQNDLSNLKHYKRSQIRYRPTRIEFATSFNKILGHKEVTELTNEVAYVTDFINVMQYCGPEK